MTGINRPGAWDVTGEGGGGISTSSLVLRCDIWLERLCRDIPSPIFE